MIQRAALSLFGGRVQRVSSSPRCHGGVVYGSPVGVRMLYGCVCVRARMGRRRVLCRTQAVRMKYHCTSS